MSCQMVCCFWAARLWQQAEDQASIHVALARQPLVSNCSMLMTACRQAYADPYSLQMPMADWPCSKWWCPGTLVWE